MPNSIVDLMAAKLDEHIKPGDAVHKLSADVFRESEDGSTMVYRVTTFANGSWITETVSVMSAPVSAEDAL